MLLQLPLLTALIAGVPPNAKPHWAYQPLTKPALPPARGGSLNPIDRFIRAKLAERGLSPAPEADRQTLIRRLTFDLIGLPPTPDEIDAFLRDRSPDAYERVVDRLLASPHFGERWARPWLDAVHFAETHGHDQDVPRENAWPYRDYLIRSFNADKPYARFIREQIAGDILYPGTPDGIIALGMLAAGPWDESSQKDIRDDTIDKKVAQYLDRDDMVTTVFLTIISTTVQCARCHDHKFDPVSQREYYGLQAAFAGVDRADRPYDLDSASARTRRELANRKRDLETGKAAAAIAASEVADWERSRPSWNILTPVSVTTANGSKPVSLPDGSIRLDGLRPQTDTYTIQADVSQRGVSALRLEVLTDPALPQNGPGRQDNGNLHLNEIRVFAAPLGEPMKRQPVAIRAASADFNQEGWDVGRAIDGNPASAWGIYPAVGKPHVAVFEFAKPLSIDGSIRLSVELQQTHGGGHLIGRPRLAITSATAPGRAEALPEELATILTTTTTQRTPSQKQTLAKWVELRAIESKLAALPAPRMIYAAAADFETKSSFKPARGCRPVQVLKRGDIRNPIETVAPGALSMIPGLSSRIANTPEEGARRAALADWLTDPGNVLTWRSIVNRVWCLHFGRGIVATPSDFGRMGSPPSHPELLDWLAVWFRDDAGSSLKKLHRLLVTSATYRQSSTHIDQKALAIDADNALCWRMMRSRLDAEIVRDAALAVSGKLDRTMGGPSVRMFIQGKGIHVTPTVDYDRFDPDAPGAHRRSIHRFHFRTLPDPLLDALDCPDASQFVATRSNTVSAQQALALLNDRFMVRQAEHFATRLKGLAPDPPSQIRAAYRLAFGREATESETTRLTRFATQHSLAAACRLLLNANEFIFVD
jgi:hypothetical protein